MRWFARNAKRWGPRGVLVAMALAVALSLLLQTLAPKAVDIATPDGPGIPPELADHQERAGLERGMAFGAEAETPLPRPDTYFGQLGIPYAFYPSPNWSGRNGCSIEAIVVHVTGPGTMAGMRNWFNNPTSQVSAHFGIGKDGEIEQYVPIESAAWHAGIVNRPNTSNTLIADWTSRGINPNRCTVGIELLLAGPAEPLTDYPKMQASLVLLLRWLNDTTKVPADRTHIIGHNELDAINRATDPVCCVDLAAVVKLVQPTSATSSVLGCEAYPCLTSNGLWRMEDGWSYDPVAGTWADPRGVVQFFGCNPDKLRWAPPIARWVVPSSAYFDPARSTWAQAPAC